VPWGWRQIGPAPIRDSLDTSFVKRNGGVVYDIAIDPRGTTDRVIFLATNGGIFKSTDGGASWDAKTDGMPSKSIGAVALNPNDPDVIFAGTGTLADPGGINFRADGLYKSTDGGDTWTALGQNIFGTSALTCAKTRDITCGRAISRIVVIPFFREIVLVATNRGLFRSVDGGANFGSAASGFTDGLPVLSGNITDLDVDTLDPATVYASIWGVGIRKSTDLGTTFPLSQNLFRGADGVTPKPNTPLLARIGFMAFAQSTSRESSPSPNTLYVNVAGKVRCTDSSGNPLSACPPLGIWKSPDRGTTWVKAAARGLGDCQCAGQPFATDQTIGVDPRFPTIVHAGMIEHFVSTDGAETFTRAPGVGHADQVAMAFSPHGSGELPAAIWVGNHGGVWLGTAGCRRPVAPARCRFTWHSRNEGLANLGLVFADIGRGSATNNAYSYAGVWDHGLATRRPADLGTDWHLGSFGDGGFVTVDPNNPLRAYGSVNSVFFATDSAGNDGWSVPLGPILQGVVWRVAVDPSSRGPSPPFTSRRLYALSGRWVFRSIDAGSSFQLIFSSSPGINPLAIAISASDPNVVWLGMTDGTLRRTGDALTAFPTWNTVSSALAPAQPVSSIAIDPDDPSDVVVGYGPATPATMPVWFTTFDSDGTSSWTNITGDLPALPVNSVLIDRSTSPASIIVANDESVMYTSDASSATTWEALGTGLPIVYNLQLAHDPSAAPQLVRVGTYGRSAFELFGPITDLRVGLRHEPALVFEGSNLTYQLFVTNTGPEPVRGIVAQLNLDPVLTFVSGGGCSTDGSSLVTCRHAGLEGGGFGFRFDVVVKVDSCPPDGTITSQASASSLLLFDTNVANNTATDTASVFCLPNLDTTITSAVDGDGFPVPNLGKTTSTSIKFTFEGSDEAASFECSLDESNFAPCASPASDDNLLSGVHEFRVRALDANGNPDPSPAEHIWTVL
jgi:hypothetical protein